MNRGDGPRTLFISDDGRVVIETCGDEKLGLNTKGLIHRSDVDLAMDRYDHTWNADLVEVLAQWRAEGCREKFITFFLIPDEILYPELSADEIAKRTPNPEPVPDADDLLQTLLEELSAEN